MPQAKRTERGGEDESDIRDVPPGDARDAGAAGMTDSLNPEICENKKQKQDHGSTGAAGHTGESGEFNLLMNLERRAEANKEWRRIQQIREEQNNEILGQLQAIGGGETVEPDYDTLTKEEMIERLRARDKDVSTLKKISLLLASRLFKVEEQQAPLFHEHRLNHRYDYAGKDENEVAAKLAKKAYVVMFERP